MRWENSWWGMDSFEFKINRWASHNDLLAENTILQWNGHQGIIEDIIHNQGASEKDDIYTYRGTNYGVFHKRICCYNTNTGTGYDRQNTYAETAMKHYVNYNCVAVDSHRKVPSLTLETDLQRGATVDYRARYQTVAEVLQEIGEFSGLGWEVSDYQFKILQGLDRSVSQTANAAVILKSEFGNIENQNYQYIASKQATTFYIGDASTGIDRTVSVYGIYDGLSRKEMFVDAPDCSTAQQRLDKGQAMATEHSATHSISINYLPSMFIYGTDFNLGDIVSYSGTDVVGDFRIIEAIEESMNDRLDIRLILNKSQADFLRLWKVQNKLNSPSLRR
jgi:hypothetical protein